MQVTLDSIEKADKRGGFFVPKSVAVIVKLTNACNYGCTYCGVSGPLVSDRKKEFNNHAHISDLYKALSNSSVKYVDFILHGGEPLLLGKKFFREMIAAQKGLLDNLTVYNSLQTNGSLIDDEWCQIFKDCNIRVGVSMDGPEDIQNFQRPALSGDSSSQTLNGIKTLIKNGIPLACVGVATAKTVRYDAEKLFHFYLDNGIKTFDFIPQEPVFSSDGRALTEDIYFTKEYGDFLVRLFDVWFDYDDPDVHIPIFEDIIRTLIDKVTKICQIGKGICGNSVFTLYPDGSLQPCDKFPRAYSDAENLITKVKDLRSFDEVFTLDKQKTAIRHQVESFKMCNGCPWLSKCRGGCVFDRYMYAKLGLDMTYLGCPTYKIYNHISETISKFNLAEQVAV